MRVRKRVIALGLCLGAVVNQFLIHHSNISYANTLSTYSEEVNYNFRLTPKENNLNNNNKVPYVSQKLTPSDIYAQNIDSMVYIETDIAQGSGVIIGKDGSFVTCFHVIADADWIKVTLNNGTTYNVKGFKYINPLEDIAILTLDTTDRFKPIKISKSMSKIGEKIFTISNPRGIHFAFSDGMINHISKDNIQFSAPISTGSSGGALLNEKGELTGIITSYITEAQNINLAIPNEYFKTKINNEAIINWYGDSTGFSTFIANNADMQQFKIYTEYAINSSNLEQLYTLMKLLIKRADFPTDAYAMVAYLALLNDDYENAILWSKNSIIENKNVEGCCVLLYLIAIFIGEDKAIIKADSMLKRFYPYSWSKLNKFVYDTYECNYDKECVLKILNKLLLYTEDLVKFDNYRMIFY